MLPFEKLINFVVICLNIAMLCLNTPLPIPLCTLSTNVKYKTKAAVLNVPVYLFGQCWYKAYLH